MALIHDLEGLHKAVAAVCPIVGVGADGTIFFDGNVTEQQRQDAHNAVAGFVDTPSGAPSGPPLHPSPPPKHITDA